VAEARIASVTAKWPAEAKARLGLARGGHVHEWLAAENGLEGIASRYCDSCLAMDEISQWTGEVTLGHRMSGGGGGRWRGVCSIEPPSARAVSAGGAKQQCHPQPTKFIDTFSTLGVRR
jgi:Domain of unknown function (DUF927)